MPFANLSVRAHRIVPTAIIVLAACVNAACRSAPAPQQTPISSDTWAVVDGKPITRDEVEKAYRRLGSGVENPSEEEALTVKLGLLDDMVVEEILLAKARNLKIEVPESEVDTAYANAKQNMAEDAFQSELTRRNLTAADMRDGLRRQLLTQKVFEREVGSKVTVTDQQVTDFFNANRSQFNLPEEAYHLAQIVITPARDPQIANRTGDDATTPQAANAKVAMLLERLKSGTAFGDLARDYSEDPESAPRGGNLGLVPMSAIRQAAPALRDAVLKATPGSARVASQNGNYTIVFVVSREPAGQRDLSMPAVREQITNTLRGRKEQLMRTAYLGAARSDAHVVNYQARRVFEAQSQRAGSQGTTAPSK